MAEARGGLIKTGWAGGDRQSDRWAMTAGRGYILLVARTSTGFYTETLSYVQQLMSLP